MDDIARLEQQGAQLDARISAKEQELCKAIRDNKADDISDLAASLERLRKDKDAVNLQLVALRQQYASLRQAVQAQSSSSPAATSKPLQTIKDLLDAMGWWAVEPKPPQALLVGAELPRQGRQQELRKIWKSIRQFFGSPPYRRALYHVHASPGVGKTYLLREVLKRLEQDIPEALREFAQEVAFAVVNFSSNTKPPEPYPDRAPWNEHIRLLLPLTLRLVYSNCCKPEVTWDRFLSAVFAANINPRSLELQPVLRLLQRFSGKTKLVLLVDELMNADLVERGLADTIRQELCRAQDTFYDEDKSFSFMALFSTLDEQLMLRERRAPGTTGPVLVTTATARPVMAATDLPMFNQEQTAKLLSAKLSDGYRTYDQEHEIPKEAVIRLLTVLTGGHGRCIEFVLKAIDNHQARSRHPMTLDRLIADAVELCGSAYAQMRLPVLELVLLGKPVQKTLALPELGGRINDLVGKGELIASFSDPIDLQMTPAVPPMFLRGWLAKNEENAAVADLHRHLKGLLDLVWKFIPEGFACFHARWEALIRHCRNAGHYRDISLFELYGRPRHSGRHWPSALLNSRVDASVLLDICGDELNWSTITTEQLQTTCWLPPNPQIAGFDALLFYPTHGEEREITLVFIENRYSPADATTKLSLEEVLKTHEHCQAFAQAHFNACDFVLLFVCLHAASDDAISGAPSNCAFLLREELTHLYGPTLMRVAESLAGGLGRAAVEGSMENAATVGPLVTDTSASASTFSTSTSFASTDLHGASSAWQDDKFAHSARSSPGDAAQAFAARSSKRSRCDAQQQEFDQAEDEESSFLIMSEEGASADNERAVPTPAIRSKRKSTTPGEEPPAIARFSEEGSRDSTAAQGKRTRGF